GGGAARGAGAGAGAPARRVVQLARLLGAAAATSAAGTVADAGGGVLPAAASARPAAACARIRNAARRVVEPGRGGLLHVTGVAGKAGRRGCGAGAAVFRRPRTARVVRDAAASGNDSVG